MTLLSTYKPWCILPIAVIIGVVFLYRHNDWKTVTSTYPQQDQPGQQQYKSRIRFTNGFPTVTRDNVVLKKGIQRQDLSCKCGRKSTIENMDNRTKQRRERELTEWKRQQSNDPVMICEAFSPLRYPAGGVTVQPLKSTRLHGLELHIDSKDFPPEDEQFHIVVRCKNSKGVLVLYKYEDNRSVRVSGNDSPKVTIIANKNEIHAINTVLANLNYKSTVYEINTRDVIYVTFLNFEISIHVHIKKTEVPRLYDPGPSGDINSLVTIITKTFERYDAVKKLISSVHTFYPNITIVVADDSEFPEKLSSPNVKHYIMPFAEGWFAGRNLALSQVRTKYLVWVDDDFVFTKGTRLENFLEKFQHPNLTIDVVGGTFGDKDGNPMKTTNCNGCRTVEVTNNYENDDGNCVIVKRNNKYHAVKEFPKCFFADGTTNFFMAKTSSTRSVGFDPFYNRMGHEEFHIDGLGKLRTMGCTDVNILHSRNTNKKYKEYRNLGGVFNPDRSSCNRHTLFKNYLKCLNF
ncbi:beta-1,4 N-acetylgalactosaminyltransferase 1-like [Glandiceps talaboti]